MKTTHRIHDLRHDEHALAFGVRILATLLSATAWVLVAQGLGAG